MPLGSFGTLSPSSSRCSKPIGNDIDLFNTTNQYVLHVALTIAAAASETRLNIHTYSSKFACISAAYHSVVFLPLYWCFRILGTSNLPSFHAHGTFPLGILVTFALVIFQARWVVRSGTLSTKVQSATFLAFPALVEVSLHALHSKYRYELPLNMTFTLQHTFTHIYQLSTWSM